MLDVRLLGNRNGRISLGRYANQLNLRQVRECGERLGDIYNDLAEHFFNSIDHPIDVFPFEAQCPLMMLWTAPALRQHAPRIASMR
jgi:hypothetical protein